MKGIRTSIPFHQKVMRHPVFLEGHYDTGFIDAHMDGGSGGDFEVDDGAEVQRVAFMIAAIAAYQRDKLQASRADAANANGAGLDPWKEFGRRSQLRGGMR